MYLFHLLYLRKRTLLQRRTVARGAAQVMHGVEDEAATLPTAAGAGWSGAASDAAGAGTIASVAAGATATAAAVVAAAAPPPEAGTTVTVAAATAAAAPVAGAYTLLAVHVPHPQTHPSAPLGP